MPDTEPGRPAPPEPPTKPGLPLLKFEPDRAKQARIASFRRWALMLAAGLAIAGFVLVLRPMPGPPAVIKPGGSARLPEAAGTGPAAREPLPGPARGQRTAVGQSPLQTAAQAASAIDSAVLSAYARWNRIDNLWTSAVAAPGDPAGSLVKLAEARSLAESAAADVRGARGSTRAIALAQEGAGIARTRVGELYSAEVALLTDLDSAAASRSRQLALIEQAFRALQLGDTVDYYVKLENPAGAEQRRAEAALKRARRQQDRVRQALRSLGPGN